MFLVIYAFLRSINSFMINITQLRKDNHIPLLVEEYPADYKGYPFLTLIKYRESEILVVVDNVTHKDIKAYVVDFCETEGINEDEFIKLVADWYEFRSRKFPLSIEFSRLGLTEQMSNILKVYNIDFVTRVIGILPMYEMSKVFSVKRRKRKTVDKNIKIVNSSKT